MDLRCWIFTASMQFAMIEYTQNRLKCQGEKISRAENVLIDQCICGSELGLKVAAVALSQ